MSAPLTNASEVACVAVSDSQPGLVKVQNSESSGATTRYLHDIFGLHRQQTPGESWVFPIMDALGSLRGVVNPTGGVLEGQDYAPYGSPFGHTGTPQTVFGFTGEQTDASGLVYLRARYYVPGLGVFPSLDPVEEGNRYGYVGGNVVNKVDPSGMVGESPERWDSCQEEFLCLTCEGISNAGLLSDCILRCCAHQYKDDLDAILSCAQKNSRRFLRAIPLPITPTPPKPLQSATVFFGGSYGRPQDIDKEGPLPQLQTPVWVEIATQSIRYPGGKAEQARLAGGYQDTELIVIGYSAGADTALIFANNFVKTNAGSGRIKCLAVLGGTMSGRMIDSKDLKVEWKGVLDALLLQGTSIYILDDGANFGDEAARYTKPTGAPGVFRFEQRVSQPHWDGGLSGQWGIGTNNSLVFRDEVMNWCNNN